MECNHQHKINVYLPCKTQMKYLIKHKGTQCGTTIHSTTKNTYTNNAHDTCNEGCIWYSSHTVLTLVPCKEFDGIVQTHKNQVNVLQFLPNALTTTITSYISRMQRMF